MLHWLEHRDWEKAFYAVIPARKFTAKPGDAAEQEDEADDDELAGNSDGALEEGEDADHAESDRS